MDKKMGLLRFTSFYTVTLHFFRFLPPFTIKKREAFGGITKMYKWNQSIRFKKGKKMTNKNLGN